MDENIGLPIELPVEDVALGLMVGGGVMPTGWVELMAGNRAAQRRASALGPTTGVYGGNQVNWEYMPQDDIDLFCEEAVAELEADGLDEDEIAAELKYWEGGDERLLGAWARDDDGKWKPVTDSESPDDDFAAIYDSNENTLQVVWSRYVRFGRWASPCYPGQVSAHNDDPAQPDAVRHVPYYALPPECLAAD